MDTVLYLARRLSSENKQYTESELIAASKYIVILAEPGGGKTTLLRSLAQQLETTFVTANVFNFLGSNAIGRPLIVDAFDELAKVDQSGIYKLLARANQLNPSHLIISSRSSEWGDSSTNAFSNFMGNLPIVVKLVEFNAEEQKAIFEDHVQGGDFEAFQAEVSRFDLDALLPNPQFLKLFADAYVENGKRFSDKRSIFSLAVERLAKEANTDVARVGSTLSAESKLELASEVFSKLLLSGAEGISTNDVSANRVYPMIGSLFASNVMAEGILATRLFRPADRPDLHSPIHKIVAEYCAADYLVKRIRDSGDPLTLPKCLAIIAPNSTVREELRGLVGWMASLGNRAVEATIIELDPYAVLANGDPSQLSPPTKRRLIERLQEIEGEDPFFRRGDSWRSFSVAGFFTSEVIGEIRPLLSAPSDGHLRDLILELLKGSKLVIELEDVLLSLVCAALENADTRLLASMRLLELPDHDHSSGSYGCHSR